MKQFKTIKLRYKIAAFLFTLLFSFAIVFAHKVYVNRQVIFNYAAFHGNVKLMKLVALLGIDVNSPGCEYQTCVAPIVLSAWYGENEAVLYLLEHGADINNNRNWGKTALIMAAFNGKEETVKLLLSKGADFDMRDKIIGDEEDNSGDTALGWAESRQYTNIVQILRDAGAK
jgi:hypothetical protein